MLCVTLFDIISASVSSLNGNEDNKLMPGSLGVRQQFDAHFYLENLLNKKTARCEKDTESSLPCVNLTLDAISDLQRRNFISRFSFAIPNRKSIETIRAYSPYGVTEVGAGIGYWAYLLNKNNIPTIGLDKYHPATNRWFSPNFNSNKKEYVSGIVVSEAVDYLATDDSERTLLMIWPSPIEEESYAAEAIAAYKGNTIIMVGEGVDGRTDTGGLFSEGQKEWQTVERVAVPQFSDCFDTLTVHKR